MSLYGRCISEMIQERSSPEFVGVRRGSSGFVGAEFAT